MDAQAKLRFQLRVTRRAMQVRESESVSVRWRVCVRERERECVRERADGKARLCSQLHQTRCAMQVRHLRANLVHIRQSRPDSGLGFQVTVLKMFKVVPSARDAGPVHQNCEFVYI